VPPSVQAHDLAEYAVKVGAAAEWKTKSMAVILHADKRTGENKVQPPNNPRLVPLVSGDCLVLTAIQYSSDFFGLQQSWPCVCGARSGNSTPRDIHREDGKYGVDDWGEVRRPQSASHACSLHCEVSWVLVAHGYNVPRPSACPYFGLPFLYAHYASLTFL